MIVLTIVFGLVFLFFSIAIWQIWFGSVMVWVILLMILITLHVANPASELHSIAVTPWVIAHAIAMVLSGALIMFATANAFLYLFSTNRLKQKKVMQVLGKVPNIEKLEQMNVFGLKASFVLMTIGLVSGIGMAVVRAPALDITVTEWLIDSKIVLILAVWILLGIILVMRHIFTVKGKTISYMTIIAFILILFAIVGTTVFCDTRHDFNGDNAKLIEQRE